MVSTIILLLAVSTFVNVGAHFGGGEQGFAHSGKHSGKWRTPTNSIPLSNYAGVEGYNTLASSEIREFNNKNVVLNLYEEVFIPKKLDAVEKYIDTKTYNNHNPEAFDGLAAFKAGFSATNGFYIGKPSVRKIAADGDLVWIHVKDDVNAYTDIWRLRNGKIIEHWDVIQALEPASSNSKNSHPFF